MKLLKETGKFALPGLFFFLLTAAVSPPEDDFKPAWWTRGGNSQTICGAMFRNSPHVPFRRENLETPDGDVLVIDWLKGRENAPLVIILHGLGGSSDTSVVHLLMKELQVLGWQAAALNARGAAGPNRLPKITHGGFTQDLDFAVREILRRRLTDRIYLVGYSIGGNQMLKWLGEKGDAVAEVKKAVAVSVPYDLALTARNLDEGFNKEVYTRELLKSLKPRALRLEARFPGLLDKEKIASADTFEIYDREVTAKLGGFKNEKEYWRASSSGFYLDKIKTPVLLIHAANDPFLPERDLPLEKMKSSPYLRVLLTGDGGHLGFVAGKIPFRPAPWLEKRILEFLSSD